MNAEAILNNPWACFLIPAATTLNGMICGLAFGILHVRAAGTAACGMPAVALVLMLTFMSSFAGLLAGFMALGGCRIAVKYKHQKRITYNE